MTGNEAEFTVEEMSIEDGDMWEDVNEEEMIDDFQYAEESLELEPPVRSDSPESPMHSKLRVLLNLIVLLAKWSVFFKVTENSFNSLLRVLGYFFKLLGKFVPSLASFSKMFPWSVHKLEKLFGHSGDAFEKYVVCSVCHSIYKYDECIDTVGSQKIPKTCSHVEFPNHPHSICRKPCGNKLLSEVELSNGSKRFYPRKVYCYRSLKESLAGLLEKDGKLEACERWRQRSLPDDVLGDVYDGNIWKEFQSVNGMPFLSAPHNLALMLNIDWFNPHKHAPYSVGAIYLVIMNLPRSERYKIENLLLVGLVPGPSEPPLTMNTYLRPLVDDLLFLWRHGITVRSVEVKSALLCVSCDIPATRKVCGFLGHSARLGCSKCTKEFTSEGFGDKMCYAGFEPHPLRMEEDHRKNAQSALNQKTSTGRSAVEKQEGSRYTALMRLPYFSCVRCHTIDPMHNLYLGTARYMVKSIWTTETYQLLPHNCLLEIQKLVDNCEVPSTMGRIPNKIAANFSNFKADQWKQWTVVFSIFALHGVLENRHLNCWRKFVKACTILDASIITKHAVEEAHALLLTFCTEAEELYGPDAITINMHLHTHLKECILDFGPPASFWVFGFERFNGYLGDYPTNNRSVEIQMMRKFIRDIEYRSLTLQTQVCGEILDHPSFDFISSTVASAGTVRDMYIQNVSPLMYEITLLTQKPLFELQESMLWARDDHISLAGLGRKMLLEAHQLHYLAEVYKILYNDSSISSSSLSSLVVQYKQLECNGQVWGSNKSISKRSSFVLAAWHGRDSQVDCNSTKPRPGIVEYYFKHCINLRNGLVASHMFAFVRWFKPHPAVDLMGYPVEVWNSNLFELPGPSNFVPFNRLYSQFVAGHYKYREENILCVCPISPKYYI